MPGLGVIVFARETPLGFSEAYEECNWCGDYRYQHEDGVGRCLTCGFHLWEQGIYYCTAFNCAKEKEALLAGGLE